MTGGVSLKGVLDNRAVTNKHQTTGFTVSPASPRAAPTARRPRAAPWGPMTHYTPNNVDLATIGGGRNRLMASFECHAGAPKV